MTVPQEEYFKLLKDAIAEGYDADTIIRLLHLVKLHAVNDVANPLIDDIIADLRDVNVLRAAALLEDRIVALGKVIAPVAPPVVAPVAAPPAESDGNARVQMTPLTVMEESYVSNLLRRKSGNGKDVISVLSHVKISITRDDLRTCCPGEYLNDQVINCYLSLVSGHRRDIFMFSTFFMTKLHDDDKVYDFFKVKRWKRPDLFKLKKVFVPINVDNSNDHWILAVIDMTQKRVSVYDSAGGTGKNYLDILVRFLDDELLKNMATPLDEKSWQLVESDPRVVPQQGNGYDCGCFLLAFAHALSLDYSLDAVTQEGMPNFRRRIVHSIARQLVKW